MSAPPRRPAPTFRPRFTLTLLYLALFVLLFGLLFALPDLLAAARELGPGEALRPEDVERARQVTRAALRGRLHLVLGCAVVVTGLGAWSGRLPGLR